MHGTQRENLESLTGIEPTFICHPYMYGSDEGVHGKKP